MLAFPVVLFVPACDGPVGGPVVPGPEGPLPDNPDVCDISERVFTPVCLACHDTGAQSPDLSALGAPLLIGTASDLYPGNTLVVAGDANASLLFRKIAGPGDDEGALMPLGGSLDPALVELVRTWIDAGAPTECVDGGEGEGEGGEGEGEGEPAADVCALLGARCTSCHNGGTIASPDLRNDAIPDLAGAASIENPGHTLVVPGDPDASLLVQKLEGTQPDDAGARMPLGQTPLSPTEIALVRAWIDDGAPADVCDGSIPVDPVDPVIEPGAPIDVGAPPSGFASNPPSFADGVNCSTGQWWQFPDDENEAFTMHPGRACIDCHADEGDEDAPTFAFAGTVMGALDDEDDCRGVPGVQVQLLDEDDQVFGTTTTNAAGNFGLCGAGGGTEDFTCTTITPRSPWRVRLSFQGRTREMTGHQDVVGDCMGCHTAEGREGAPGRVVAP